MNVRTFVKDLLTLKSEVLKDLLHLASVVRRKLGPQLNYDRFEVVVDAITDNCLREDLGELADARHA